MVTALLILIVLILLIGPDNVMAGIILLIGWALKMALLIGLVGGLFMLIAAAS